MQQPDQIILMQTLKDCMQEYALQNRFVEQALGMPLNSLTNFLKLKKRLPDKWKIPIENFCTETTVAGAEFTEDAIIPALPSWVPEIEAYCRKEGITPLDLIDPSKIVAPVPEKAPLVQKDYDPNNNPIYRKKMGL